MTETAPLAAPKASDKVYKDECMLCFCGAESPGGLDVCLHCYQGFCTVARGGHRQAHSAKHPSHRFYVNLRRQGPTLREGKNEDESESPMPSPKLTRLEVPAETEPEHKLTLRLACALAEDDSAVEAEAEAKARGWEAVAEQIVNASSASIKAAQGGGDSWTEPAAQACEHCLLVEAPAEGLVSVAGSNGVSTCSQCDLRQNLWICLVCGVLSCGRRQFDGSGGNGHALAHFKATGHALACKLGTLTPEGENADVYCYACDDMVKDPMLAEHLAVVGIDLSGARKTEQSTAELQLTMNLTHTYAMTDSEGRELKALRGPGLRGFKNLGNSCYLATVLQALRNLPGSVFGAAHLHAYATCPAKNPAECLPCQVGKIAVGLSGEEQPDELRPWMFKTLIGVGHAEFSSGRQQDAAEFLGHLQGKLAKAPLGDARVFSRFLGDFEFDQVQGLVCVGCGKERVSRSKASSLALNVAPLLESSVDGKTRIELEDLLRVYFAPEEVEIKCPDCPASRAMRSLSMATLPRHLVLVVNRFRLRNWVPEKAICAVAVPERVCLASYVRKGDLQPLETESFRVDANPELLGQLLLLGIDEESARKALVACSNASVDAAMQMIFGGSEVRTADPAAVELLTSAGFSEEQAREALEACDYDPERAFDRLLSHQSCEKDSKGCTEAALAEDTVFELNSFLTHRGLSMHCGHYVAHLRQEAVGWVLYNDEKVAEAAVPVPSDEAYIYMYTAK